MSGEIARMGLLGWLKALSFLKASEPLPMTPHDGADDALRRLVSETPEPAALFRVSEDGLDYQTHVPAADRAKIEAFVSERYRPVVME